LFNGTIADERGVLDVCLGQLYLGDRQVVRSPTRGGLPPPGAEERALVYLRENLKNREQHPVEPDLNPGGRLTCVDDGEFERIFRDGEGWDRFRRTFPESDGTLRFSRVGLDREVTQAMLYAGQQFDWNVEYGGFWNCSYKSGKLVSFEVSISASSPAS